MSVISIGKVTRLRDERELDFIASSHIGPDVGQDVRGEVEAYSMCLKLIESLGRKVATVVNGRVFESVEIGDGAVRRVVWAMDKIKNGNQSAISSSGGKTAMLEYLRGHIKGMEEVLRILEKAD